MPAPGVIDPRTTMGPVRLAVRDVDRSVAFYEQVLGLELRLREGAQAELGIGERALVALVEVPGARPVPRSTGLFHLALLLPARGDLARWLGHVVERQVGLEGLADHAVSEAIYLRDPDGHGIEVYADRPRATWEGRVGELMTTQPLDVRALMAAAGPDPAPFETAPPSTVMGHVHLQVADLDEAIGFYHHLLGFELLARLGGQAAFLGAGGYHHHIGVNTWTSLGAPPPPAGAAALRELTVQFADEPARAAAVARLRAAEHPIDEAPRGPVVRDPSANAVLLAVAR